jgi:tRNA nucleotidyltransferase (CCA-adding enzyme)
LSIDSGSKLISTLPQEARALLEQVARLASGLGTPAFLVGGSVRDALLAAAPTDLDVSVEGDALQVATVLADELGVKAEGYERFGTCRVAFPHSPYHIDLNTARRESYSHPGALPVVEAGSIFDDLARRDFTINAMAAPLSSSAGSLIDPHHGRADLKRGEVAVLHDGSFQDDPTRIFRAVRFSERLGFRIAPNTLELVLGAVRDGALHTISVDRLSHELMLTLEEPRAGRMLSVLDRLGVLEALYPGLHWPFDPKDELISEDAAMSREERRDAYLTTLGSEYAGDPEKAEGLARHLRLPAPQIRLMRSAAALTALWPMLSDPKLPDSRLYRLLRPLDTKALETFIRIDRLQADQGGKQKVDHYLRNLRHVRPLLTGRFLLSRGITPGPMYKQLLDDLLAAKLDGLLSTRAEEEQFLKERLLELNYRD